MSINKERTFNAFEIRDTNSHNGNTVYNGNFIIKTIIVENDLNEQITLQCQASANADFSKCFNVGSPFNVNANKSVYQTCETYFPYFRMVGECENAPTTGDLTIIILGVN